VLVPLLRRRWAKALAVAYPLLTLFAIMVAVLVGVPTPEMTIELPLIDVFSRGGSTKSSWYGDCLPSRDFPALVDLHLQGRLDLDAFVTDTIGLDEVERAFDDMHEGTVLRSVVVL
jgi:S-(hydroxymethyl)mycothiol dehydrogenase